jgi:O-antigen ligase
MADADRLKGRALNTLNRLSAWLPGALMVFAAAGFLLPKEPDYALLFYVAVLPCLLARLAVARAVPLSDPVRLLAVCLIAWSGLTLLWGTDDKGRSWRFAADTVATFAFLVAMLLGWREAASRARLATVLVAAGTANAVWSIAVFVVTHPIYPRLRGWGATKQEILGAAVMSIPALTALARALVPVASRRSRVLNLAAFLIMAAFILLTESRGPLLAGTVALLFLCSVSVWRLRAFLGIAAFGAVWLLLPRAAQEHSATVLIRRGSSHRFEIWDYTLNLIRDRPLFGHGLAANLHLNVGDTITFPHDLYLSLLFYSGIVGFLLFVAMAGLLSWRLLPARADWRDTRHDPDWAWLTALWIDVLMIGLTDLGQITKGPGPLWFIVWLPLGLLMTALPRRLKEKSTAF